MKSRIGLLALAAALAVGACGDNQVDHDRRYLVEPRMSQAQTTRLHANETPELRRLIEKYAAEYQVPVDLVHRVIIRESHHRPGARNGPYYGLMQILPATARGMGYRGPASGLLDAETNLKYGVKYLRGAYLVAGGNYDGAVKWYSRGYYYEAKRKGLLEETGLR
ncbi:MULTISPECIES: lytic transglycosylase domain-containing protein [unclassified Paracoccus (in: a-proteobacteria)]|uniref:lytic transglycosylase domain-containing protein n=1 Tax=unclassified Paracoccus (in: a-proteobacteria) TaxID=2688777 RepID=UPI0012B33267|nr:MULTISPECIES: lytic transglycosylase domain-containing protein [unclassified Paracoccus (in: a-proteobacteria)]UXU75293.1 lytic transglycosylase domain-containing protein [Paracoccus sp. SMMA_5]UXU81195.1 lytic transglycosylase domain-containing protein [Paracoccus sp. SMMA_5_TC]